MEEDRKAAARQLESSRERELILQVEEVISFRLVIRMVLQRLELRARNVNVKRDA